MSKKSKGSKRVSRPNEEEEVAGVIASYDQEERKVILDIGNGETAILDHRVFAKAGHSKVKIGARMRCSVISSLGGRMVVSIHQYNLRSGVPAV